MRVLPHGTVMIWDPVAERAYPFYRAGHDKYHRREFVKFVTDETDTFVVAVARPSGSGRPKGRLAYAVNRTYLVPHPR